VSKIFIVYEIKGPNGYIPFIYTKNTLDSVMLDNLKNDNINYNLFDGIEKLLISDVLNNSKYHDDNTYLIPIDRELEKYDLDFILSDELIKFIKTHTNFYIIYVNYGVEILHSLV
jgi:hypothetical protein